jgi:Skp family chaperone for outer membrane proteins
MKTADRVISKIALPVMGLAAVMLILVFILSTRGQSKENNGYIRVINCIISIPATERNQGDIETCYQRVESEVGLKLQRYDATD